MTEQSDEWKYKFKDGFIRSGADLISLLSLSIVCWSSTFFSRNFNSAECLSKLSSRLEQSWSDRLCSHRINRECFILTWATKIKIDMTHATSRRLFCQSLPSKMQTHCLCPYDSAQILSHRSGSAKWFWRHKGGRNEFVVWSSSNISQSVI